MFLENCHCKDEVELEEAIALAKAMEISRDQTELPQVPGLSTKREEETITIHIQQDQTVSTSVVWVKPPWSGST